MNIFKIFKRIPKRARKVMYQEAASLWHDYAIALKNYESPDYAERCRELSHRIIILGELIGPVHWRDVPVSILTSHYEILYLRGNISFQSIRWGQVNEVQRAMQRRGLSIVLPTPVTINDFILMEDPRGDFTAIMDIIQGEHDANLYDATCHL